MIHLYFFLVGAIIASFLGLVIDRFPEQSIVFPASHCDSCQTRLRPLDLIPFLSQVFNRFRCRYCKSSYPVWYAFFELSLGLLFLAESGDCGIFNFGASHLDNCRLDFGHLRLSSSGISFARLADFSIIPHVFL